MKYFAGGIFLMLLSFGLGLVIEYFAPNKTMMIKLLWAFIPSVTFLIYTSFLGAVLLRKCTDKLSAMNKD